MYNILKRYIINFKNSILKNNSNFVNRWRCIFSIFENAYVKAGTVLITEVPHRFKILNEKLTCINM